MVEGGFHFQAAAADEAGLSQEFHFRIFGDFAAGFVGLLAIEKDLPGEDQRLGLFARGSEAAFDDELVETNLRHELALPLDDEIGQSAQGGGFVVKDR